MTELLHGSLMTRLACVTGFVLVFLFFTFRIVLPNLDDAVIAHVVNLQETYGLQKFDSTAMLYTPVDGNENLEKTPKHSNGEVQKSAMRNQKEGRKPRDLEERLKDIGNSTLGFQKVFVLGMSERTDKRDRTSLIARLSGIDIEWVDGVHGESILAKTIPENFAHTKWAEDIKTIACWRAHMNIAQRMISDNIQTAFIFEDDVDWDVFFRTQLVEYARGVNYLESNALARAKTTVPYTDSPFGDNWDLQWVGNCGVERQEDLETEYYITRDDPTAIPDALIQRSRSFPNFNSPALLESNFTRAIFPPTTSWCMYGYGLSLRGAQRSVYLQAVENKATAIDEAYDAFCRDKTLGFNCYTIWPSLVGTHRAAGSSDKDSDRDRNFDGDYRESATSVSIVFSMIMNARNLIEGKKVVESQWPGLTMMDEIELGSGLPSGETILIKPGEYAEKFWEPQFGGPRYEPPW